MTWWSRLASSSRIHVQSGNGRAVLRLAHDLTAAGYRPQPERFLLERRHSPPRRQTRRARPPQAFGDRRLAAADGASRCRRQLVTPPSKCSRRMSLILCIASLCWVTASLLHENGAKGDGRKRLASRRLDRGRKRSAGDWPLSRTVFRHHGGQHSVPATKVAAIRPEHCPPWRRNSVRHHSGILSVMARNTQSLTVIGTVLVPIFFAISWTNGADTVAHILPAFRFAKLLEYHCRRTAIAHSNEQYAAGRAILFHLLENSPSCTIQTYFQVAAAG